MSSKPWTRVISAFVCTYILSLTLRFWNKFESQEFIHVCFRLQGTGKCLWLTLFPLLLLLNTTPVIESLPRYSRFFSNTTVKFCEAGEQRLRGSHRWSICNYIALLCFGERRWLRTPFHILCMGLNKQTVLCHDVLCCTVLNKNLYKHCKKR